MVPVLKPGCIPCSSERGELLPIFSGKDTIRVVELLANVPGKYFTSHALSIASGTLWNVI